MNGGQVYIKVQADETMPMVMNVSGSGGNTQLTYTVSWTPDGGITNKGWQTPSGGYMIISQDPEEMNKRVHDEFTGHTLPEILPWIMAGCAV